VTILAWIAGAIAVIVIGFWLLRRTPRDSGLGSVSGQWLDNHRRETHRED
jgi:hypothetical protein